MVIMLLLATCNFAIVTVIYGVDRPVVVGGRDETVTYAYMVLTSVVLAHGRI